MDCCSEPDKSVALLNTRSSLFMSEDLVNGLVTQLMRVAWGGQEGPGEEHGCPALALPPSQAQQLHPGNAGSATAGHGNGGGRAAPAKRGSTGSTAGAPVQQQQPAVPQPAFSGGSSLDRLQAMSSGLRQPQSKSFSLADRGMPAEGPHPASPSSHSPPTRVHRGGTMTDLAEWAWPQQPSSHTHGHSHPPLDVTSPGQYSDGVDDGGLDERPPASPPVDLPPMPSCSSVQWLVGACTRPQCSGLLPNSVQVGLRGDPSRMLEDEDLLGDLDHGWDLDGLPLHGGNAALQVFPGQQTLDWSPPDTGVGPDPSFSPGPGPGVTSPSPGLCPCPSPNPSPGLSPSPNSNPAWPAGLPFRVPCVFPSHASLLQWAPGSGTEPHCISSGFLQHTARVLSEELDARGHSPNHLEDLELDLGHSPEDLGGLSHDPTLPGSSLFRPLLCSGLVPWQANGGYSSVDGIACSPLSSSSPCPAHARAGHYAPYETSPEPNCDLPTWNLVGNTHVPPSSPAGPGRSHKWHQGIDYTQQMYGGRCEDDDAGGHDFGVSPLLAPACNMSVSWRRAGQLGIHDKLLNVAMHTEGAMELEVEVGLDGPGRVGAQSWGCFSVDASPDLSPGFGPDLTTDLSPGLSPDLSPDLSPGLSPDLSPSLTPGLSPDLCMGMDLGLSPHGPGLMAQRHPDLPEEQVSATPPVDQASPLPWADVLAPGPAVWYDRLQQQQQQQRANRQLDFSDKCPESAACMSATARCSDVAAISSSAPHCVPHAGPVTSAALPRPRQGQGHRQGAGQGRGTAEPPTTAADLGVRGRAQPSAPPGGGRRPGGGVRACGPGLRAMLGPWSDCCTPPCKSVINEIRRGMSYKMCPKPGGRQVMSAPPHAASKRRPRGSHGVTQRHTSNRCSVQQRQRQHTTTSSFVQQQQQHQVPTSSGRQLLQQPCPASSNSSAQQQQCRTSITMITMTMPGMMSVDGQCTQRQQQANAGGPMASGSAVAAAAGGVQATLETRPLKSILISSSSSGRRSWSVGMAPSSPAWSKRALLGQGLVEDGQLPMGLARVVKRVRFGSHGPGWIQEQGEGQLQLGSSDSRQAPSLPMPGRPADPTTTTPLLTVPSRTPGGKGPMAAAAGPPPLVCMRPSKPTTCVAAVAAAPMLQLSDLLRLALLPPLASGGQAGGMQGPGEAQLPTAAAVPTVAGDDGDDEVRLAPDTHGGAQQPTTTHGGAPQPTKHGRAPQPTAAHGGAQQPTTSTRLVPDSISRQDLISCRVLAQVDAKFIFAMAGNGSLLVFDMHAAHERVRLEHLQLRLFEVLPAPGGCPPQFCEAGRGSGSGGGGVAGAAAGVGTGVGRLLGMDALLSDSGTAPKEQPPLQMRLLCPPQVRSSTCPSATLPATNMLRPNALFSAATTAA